MTQYRALARKLAISSMWWFLGLFLTLYFCFMLMRGFQLPQFQWNGHALSGNVDLHWRGMLGVFILSAVGGPMLAIGMHLINKDYLRALADAEKES